MLTDLTEGKFGPGQLSKTTTLEPQVTFVPLISFSLMVILFRYRLSEVATDWLRQIIKTQLEHSNDTPVCSPGHGVAVATQLCPGGAEMITVIM